MKARIIGNPISGGGRSVRMAEQVGGRLLGMGYDVTFCRTRPHTENQELFPDPCDLVVVIGGDGTINRVVNALPLENPPRMAILPTGTANVLARELGLPLNIDRLCSLIESGSVIEFDTMLCGDSRCLLMAGAGLDAEVTRLMGLTRKGPLSFFSYIRPIYRAVRRYRFPPIQVMLDDRLISEDASIVIVTNVSTYGGPITIAPDADPSDGLFDVCVIHSRSPMRIFGFLAHAFAMRGLPKPDVEFYRGQKIELTSSRKVPLQVDGDFLKYLPATVTMNAPKVAIVAPGKST